VGVFGVVTSQTIYIYKLFQKPHSPIPTLDQPGKKNVYKYEHITAA